ncbi:MAG: hypothetical protein EA362_02840 [Saprospirales bacterium]|nr:MAG: hypothetical protein EA362_02840 [Saprospirales bacterium]
MKEEKFESFALAIYPFKIGFVLIGLCLFSVGSLFSQSTSVSSGGQGVDPQPGSDVTKEYLDLLNQVEFLDFDEALVVLSEAIADVRSSLQNIQAPSSSVLRQANIKSDYWRILMNLIHEAESDPSADFISVLISSIPSLHNIFVDFGAKVVPYAENLFEETIDMLKK